jgi:DNA repair exonuclease SbcCD ATPase subunit
MTRLSFLDVKPLLENLNVHSSMSEEEDDLIERLNRITVGTEEHINTQLFNHQIASASLSITRLSGEEQLLGDRLVALEREKSQLPAGEAVAPDLGLPPKAGTFFQQLRSLETEQERLVSERDSLHAQIRHVKGAINETTARRQRLSNQSDVLRGQLSENEARVAQLSATIEQQTSQLLALNQQLIREKQNCEDVKLKVKALATELQLFTPDQMSLLVAQRTALEDELRAEKERLGDASARVTKATTGQRLSQKSRANQTKALESPAMWMSERAAYLGKIKKARAELEQLKNRERGVAKSNETTEARTAAMNFTDDEIKRAIIAETNSFPQEVFQFQKDTLNTEIGYDPKLEEQITELKRSLAQVEEYGGSIITLLK